MYFLSRPDRHRMISVTESCREIPIRNIMEEGVDPNTPLNWSGDYYGPKDLRERIIESQMYGDLPIDNVTVTNGTNVANFIAAVTAVKPGAEVIIAMPQWTQGYAICKYILKQKSKSYILRKRLSARFR